MEDGAHDGRTLTSVVYTKGCSYLNRRMRRKAGSQGLTCSPDGDLRLELTFLQTPPQSLFPHPANIPILTPPPSFPTQTYLLLRVI
ncbi:hypothetical protein C0Q70_21583 [Pomacea canaliculata]|uniref:Uncharacterized protein n=1 Tax=Pomacea canaliculata TaxID=400727 RepID=A0A2T7NCX4_POMCA|nr:hypothetical protein C0Q70_21583 [Pomacea canaliculata]